MKELLSRLQSAGVVFYQDIARASQHSMDLERETQKSKKELPTQSGKESTDKTLKELIFRVINLEHASRLQQFTYINIQRDFLLELGMLQQEMTQLLEQAEPPLAQRDKLTVKDNNQLFMELAAPLYNFLNMDIVSPVERINLAQLQEDLSTCQNLNERWANSLVTKDYKQAKSAEESLRTAESRWETQINRFAHQLDTVIMRCKDVEELFAPLGSAPGAGKGR